MIFMVKFTYKLNFVPTIKGRFTSLGGLFLVRLQESSNQQSKGIRAI